MEYLLNKVLTTDDQKVILPLLARQSGSTTKRGEHGTMKPVELLKRVIKISSNEMILFYNPFYGSGSTGSFIFKILTAILSVFELDETYF